MTDVLLLLTTFTPKDRTRFTRSATAVADVWVGSGGYDGIGKQLCVIGTNFLAPLVGCSGV